MVPAAGARTPRRRTAANAPSPRKVRIPHLHAMKAEGRKWAMLTAYDMYAAQIFDEAGIPVLLVGDSAGNNVYGYETTVPVTLDEMIPLVRAVSTAARRALVVADLPFGSYGGVGRAGLRERRAPHEGGARPRRQARGRHARWSRSSRRSPTPASPSWPTSASRRRASTSSAATACRAGATPPTRLVDEARALQDAGAFAVVLEMVPAPVAARVTEVLSIPTIGIGAGNGTDAQVLVWSDFAGLRSGKAPRFVKKYADLRGTLLDAARAYAADVESGAFPDTEHSFES